MNDDELIKEILGEYFAHSIRIPQMIPKVFKHHNVNMQVMVRDFLVRYAIELDPENSKLKILKEKLS